ncbi:hypothetical protein EMIT0232MI5_70068 [Pseudomonas sp. IT-232MI5]
MRHIRLQPNTVSEPCGSPERGCVAQKCKRDAQMKNYFEVLYPRPMSGGTMRLLSRMG